MIGFIFRQDPKPLNDMTDKELVRGAKLRYKVAPVLPWAPFALGIVATLALFSVIPAMGAVMSLGVSLAVGWGVQKLTGPAIAKTTNRIRNEQRSMEMLMLARITAREKEEKKAAAAAPAAAPAASNENSVPAAKAAEDFARAKETGMPLEQAIAVKGPLKFKKPGAGASP